MRAPASGLALFPVWLMLGPRQVGKSSLLKHCSAQQRQFVDLDDLNVRARAHQDPEFFFSNLKPPLFIDEIQYAPELLSPIKRWVDAHPGAPGQIWLSGSQNFEVMSGVRETLAGRVAILNLLGLSDTEKGLANEALTPQDYFESILETTFPKLREVADPFARSLFLTSYTKTYIERDVRELLGIEKRREFEIFVKLCSLRTGQLVNLDDLGRDTGVSPLTVKSWLSVLEDSFLIKLVHPHFSNRSKRLIKSPKIYFLDMGLAAHIGGWSQAETLRLGPLGGAAFETQIFTELHRNLVYRLLPPNISFYRTRDNLEVDFLVEILGKTYPIEVNMGTPVAGRLPNLTKISEPEWQLGRVVSLTAKQGSEVPLTSEWSLIHPLDLGHFIDQAAQRD